MNIVYADLETVLKFRDERAAIQNEFLQKYRVPIISFTMNIAGPVKRSDLIDFVFNDGVRQIKSAMGEPLCCRILRDTAGSAAILAYDAPASEIKEKCISIESCGEVGRLLDIDVIDVSGKKLSRNEERHCLICGGPVAVCARSRAHSLGEIQAKTNDILSCRTAQIIADKAVSALIDEVSLTPKPGLVDMNDSGAHTDMDWALMVKSANSLREYFRQAALLGLENMNNMPARLQQTGIEAEKVMLGATGGVNTHKGAIYSLGLLCAAKACCLSENADAVCNKASQIATQLSVSKATTHGSSVRKIKPTAGPRKEAYDSFPNVRYALNMLVSGENEKMVLLELISRLDDSNVIWRGGEDGLEFMRREAGTILNAPAESREMLLTELNTECIRRNLSPGGAADLLAAALFMRSLDT